jgi:hypothetical protein
MNGRISFLFLLLAGVLLAGCAGGPDTALPSSPVIPARNGAFTYRIPPGWFDASADSQAQGHIVLLIRNDYGATIAVDEVQLDEAARGEIRREGLLPAAQLLLSLTSWEQHAVLTDAPHMVSLGDRAGCRYGMVTGDAGDALDVTVVETQGRVFAVTVLLAGKRSAGEVPVVRESFLGAVRW